MANFKISASIITLNEAEHIRATCESVAWADEIVVVDSGSTDQTQAIARECGARVIERPWPGFASQKQFAAEHHPQRQRRGERRDYNDRAVDQGVEDE